MNSFQLTYLIIVPTVWMICYVCGLKHSFFRELSITLCLVLQVVYLLWESVYTLPMMGWMSLVVGLALLLTKWPEVEIIIATYNESVGLLHRLS